jgi:tetratricopeptide (TPR) repeat protein
MSSTFDRKSLLLSSKTTDRLPMLMDDFHRWPSDNHDLLSLSPERRETYKDLLRSLKRKTGFGLFFAVQPIPAKVDRIIKSLEKDLSLKKIAILELDRDAKTMFDRVDQIYAENHFDILCIKGIENALYDYEDTQRLSGWTTEEVYSYSWKGVPPILNHLNQQRDRFSTEFPSSSFVFFLPSFAVDYFVQRAPDFFDWRSGLFEFPTDKQELADKFDEVTNGSFASYLKLSKEEKIKKILDIKELLQQDIDLKTHAKLYSEMALLFLSGGQFIKSLASLDRCIDLSHDRHEKYVQLINRGNMLGILERYEEALASFDRAFEINHDNYIAWFHHGEILGKLERYEEALASLDKAITLNSDDYRVWSLRGNMLGRLERYEEALVNFDRAVEINPDEYIAWFHHGGILGRLERYEEALVSFDRAIEINPANYESWVNRGNALANLERYEEALASLDRAIETNYDNYETWAAWLNRGNVLNNLERYEESLASLDRAISLNLDRHESWVNHGNTLINLERYEESLASLDRAIEIEPNDYIAWFNRGSALANLERYKESLASYNRAIALNHRFAKNYDFISRVHYMQGELNLAIAKLTKAINAKLSDNSTCWNNLGFFYLVKNKLEEATKCFLKSLQKRPDQFISTFNLALIHTRKKHWKLSKQIIERSLTLCENRNNQEKLYMAIGKIALGQEQEGLETIQEILENRKNSRLHNLLRGGIIESAEILARSNYFPGTEKALQIFQAALDQNTDRV